MRKTVFTALAFLLYLPASQGQFLASVDESGIRATLKNGSTVVSVPVINTANSPLHATLSLSWVSPKDLVLESARSEATLPPGRSQIDLPLPITESSLWTRLRYSLTPETGNQRPVAATSGIVSIPRIADHVFELKVGHAGVARRGGALTFQAQAIHPISRKPVAADKWDAKLTVDQVAISPSKIASLTEGMVEFTFDVPETKESDPNAEASLWVQAHAGDFVQDVRDDLPLPGGMSARVQTDKPIYQPGQTIHFRAIVFDPQGKVADNAEVKFEISDQDNETAHTAKLVTSRFGIVKDDWTLPLSAGLGPYVLQLTTQDDDRVASHIVRVSRYDLPTFNVTAKPDRSAYLPNQKPSVTITGAYLFGKPVPQGKVKIVHNGESRWNPGKRKLESDDKTVAQGEAGQNGTFTTTLDVTEAQDEIKGSARDRFKDEHYVAYYTDPSSGRTEQRRFDMRITREPIHVYLIRSDDGGPLPLTVYVATSYAEGRPAQTTVELVQDGHKTAVQTNRYGVGKATLPPGDSDSLEARATDANGLVGTWKEQYWSDGGARLRLETKRSLYRAGESVTLQITAPLDGPADQLVVVHALADDTAVARQVVHILDRKAEVTFPFQPQFRRKVIFAAWGAADSHADLPVATSGSRTVLFPDRSDLHVTATMDRGVYKPGEHANLRMQVNSVDGKPLEAALGVAVVDQAVLERARTDQEFGHRPWFACAFCRDDGEAEFGGIRLNDLYTMSPDSPVTHELDLVAEVLARGGGYIWTLEGETLGSAPRFASVEAQMKQLKVLLDQHYADTLEFPQDASALSRALGQSFTTARDPWGRMYEPRFSVVRDHYQITLISPGPDKLLNTSDDFTAGTFQRGYFTPIQSLIERSLPTEDDYPATADEFKALLSRNGLLLDSSHDPWGTPYRASVRTQLSTRRIQILSAGPDRVFGTFDDVIVATFNGRYFSKEGAEIAHVLKEAESKKTSPQDNEGFRLLLQQAGIDLSRFRDPWNHPYRVISVIASRFSDRTQATSVRVFGSGLASTRTDVTPVTQLYVTFSLRSAGEDGIEDTYDDFDVARFPLLLKEESAGLATTTLSQPIALAPGTGAISGMVTDPTGAVIPNATVVLRTAGQTDYEAVTGPDGVYHFLAVPAGSYTVRATSPGFQQSEIVGVPVGAGKATSVNIELTVGSVSEQVAVSAEALPLQTASAQLSARTVSTSTPRVREYFPETLLWLPDVTTDTHGSARTEFRMGDSVTSWKLAAIASTLDGRVAETESELRTFQPFFLDFNPPQVLTEGDRIDLAIAIRNYQERGLDATLTLQANDAFSIQGPSTKRTPIPANSSVNVSFAITAAKSKEKATQRVIARAARNQDAIEKSTRVHPNGQEVTQSFGDLLAGNVGFSVNIPPNAIPAASRGELRLYPNIASVLLESAGSIMNAPHGCAEQTISAGYANLLAWRFAKVTGAVTPKIENTASANVQLAIEGLARFRDAQGGVTYWGTGDPDIAVTAYAVSFLVEASAVVPVDRDDITAMITWLDNQQRPDGQWQTRYRDKEPAGKQEQLLTGLVVRSLASAKKAGMPVNNSRMAQAYRYIARFTDQIDEPYLLSQFILASLDSGDEAQLGTAVERLKMLAREERGGVYWDLRTNTPFYGWGTAGRLETTGLVVSALSGWRSEHPQETDIDPLIRRGLVFLLRGRDQWGGWFTTQSTVRAMRAMADASAVLGNFGGGSGKIEVRINGRAVMTIATPSSRAATDPILVDVSTFINPGQNQIELVQSAGTQSALLRLATTYWLPWDQTAIRSSQELRLSAQFDRLNPHLGELVRCKVKAERVGFRGYGMMVAEIGLPPATEVDRASLESVMEDGSLGVDHYEILPDRIVFYLWPKAGGASFDFYVSARLPMNANSNPSLLYDYYNPEALAELAAISHRGASKKPLLLA